MNNCQDCPRIQVLEKDIEDHKEALGKHDDEIGWIKDDITELKADGREYKTEIKNLCKKMDDLINTVKWGLGIFVTVSIFVIGLLLKN